MIYLAYFEIFPFFLPIKKVRRIIGLNVISEELYFEAADLANELSEEG